MVQTVETGMTSTVVYQQIPRCTVSKVEAIISKYPTFASLLKAYASLSTVQQKEDLLKNLSDKNGKNTIGPALSRSIYHCLFGQSQSSFLFLVVADLFVMFILVFVCHF